MQVAIIQTTLHWEQKDANLKMFDDWIEQINQAVDLILLPEMFTTGFTMQPQLFAETLDGTTARWMQKHAMNKQAAVAGSFITTHDEKYYNTMLIALPNGKLEHYHKRHLFSYGNEQLHYSVGKEKVLIHYQDWQLNPVIC
jgi:omega-amidase